MENLSIKDISAGILATLVLSIPVGIMFSYFFIEIYNDVAPGVNFANEEEVDAMADKMMYHPLSIAFLVLATFITVGFPGYISALVANKGYTLNSVSIGVFALLVSFLNYELMARYPKLFVFLAVFTLFVAYLSGLLRHRQVMKSEV